jgi:hypothetical protein
MERTDELIRAFRILQKRANSKDSQASYSWSAISNMIGDQVGIELNYDNINPIIQSTPELKKLIKSYSGKGVVLNTKAKEAPTEFGQSPGVDMGAAKSAAKNVLQQPG